MDIFNCIPRNQTNISIFEEKEWTYYYFVCIFYLDSIYYRLIFFWKYLLSLKTNFISVLPPTLISSLAKFLCPHSSTLFLCHQHFTSKIIFILSFYYFFGKWKLANKLLMQCRRNLLLVSICKTWILVTTLPEYLWL